MCCSGNHKHSKESSQNGIQNEKTGGSFHLPMMMLCCLLPLVVIPFLGTSGIGGTIRNALPLLMLAFCIIPHFLMKGHSHGQKEACCKKETLQPPSDQTS